MRVLPFKLVPLGEVALGLLIGKALTEALYSRPTEAKKYQPILVKERRDVGDRQLVLLCVEQQVAAFAGGEEVRVTRDVRKRGAKLLRHEFLAATSDVVN